MQDLHAKASEKFWPRVNKRSGVYGVDGNQDSQCWEWTGGIMSKGYGIIQIDRVQYRTHRLAWILHTNVAISPQQFVCHHCDNPKCVRPDHLFLGDAKINARDRNTKGRQARGDQQGLSTLTEAQLFNCSRANIHYVVAGDTWKHIDTRVSI